MDNPDNWFRCSVCAKKTRFSYLKAQLCRACAAFFRRAITEELEYKCYHDLRCKSRNRSFCRLCRLNKCIQMGATLDKDDESDNESMDRHVELDFSKALAPFPTFFKQSKLSDLTNGYDSFLVSQRLLVMCANPELEVSDNNLIETSSRGIIINIDNGSLPMMLSMFHDYYRVFQSIPMSKQIEIAAQVGHDFFNYHKTYLTYKHFPQPDDYFRVMLSNGHYMNVHPSNADKFIKKSVNKEKYGDFYRMVLPLATKQTYSYREFKILKMQKRDIACFMYLNVFKHIEYSGLMTEEMRRFQDDLFKEWYEDIKEERGPANAAEHFSKIMQYYINCNNLYNDFKNLNITMSVQNFYKDEAPLIIDHNKCVRYLNSSDRESITQQMIDSERADSPPLDFDDFDTQSELNFSSCKVIDGLLKL